MHVLIYYDQQIRTKRKGINCFFETNKCKCKENVFINKKDIFEEKSTLNDIFIRQTLNQINFGKLLIKSNGDIYSNPNDIKLGKIKINTIYDSVFKEMDSGRSWWNIRTKVKPCNKCIYNLICPPISNYEKYMMRYNLCHIHK